MTEHEPEGEYEHDLHEPLHDVEDVEYLAEDEPLDFVILPAVGIPVPPHQALAEIERPGHAEHSGLVALAKRAVSRVGLVGAAAGWGNPGSGIASRVVAVRGRGITLYVHREVAPIFGHLVVDIDNHLRARGRSLSRQADDWGYAHRRIRGGLAWSNHAWGLAVDLNALKNPMTTRLITEFDPGWVDNLMRTKYRGLLRWGGRYRGKKDSMHFEFMGTPAQARALAAALKGGPKPQPPTPGHRHVMPVLRLGSSGAYVRDAQGHLNYAYRGLRVSLLLQDGKYGQGTKDRVADWQRRVGLRVDGQIGPATWAKLHAVTDGKRHDAHGRAF